MVCRSKARGKGHSAIVSEGRVFKRSRPLFLSVAVKRDIVNQLAARRGGVLCLAVRVESLYRIKLLKTLRP